MSSSVLRDTSGSVLAGGAVASLLSAVAVYLISSSTPLAQRSANLFARHVTFSAVIFAAVFAVLWLSFGILLGLYGKARESATSNFTKALECSIAATVLLGLCMTLTVPKPPLLRVLAAFLGCALACELARLGMGKMLRERTRRVVIVGCDRLAAKAWREFRVHPDLHMQLAGFVNQSACAGMMPDIASRCLGDIESLPRIVLDKEIDDVIVATPVGSHSQVLEQSIAGAGALGARILCLKDICGIHPETITREHGDILFELIPAPRLGGLEHAAKRIFDVTVAATMLSIGTILLLPFSIVCLVRRRPIAYRPLVQLGFRRRRYCQLRLHSAPVGHRIKLFLDLLPHMWNVFCGHLSLVGPPPVSEAEIAQADIAALAGRFNVRPGVIVSDLEDSAAAASAANSRELSSWSLRKDVKDLARAVRAQMDRSAAIETEAGAL